MCEPKKSYLLNLPDALAVYGPVTLPQDLKGNNKEFVEITNKKILENALAYVDLCSALEIYATSWNTEMDDLSSNAKTGHKACVKALKDLKAAENRAATIKKKLAKNEQMRSKITVLKGQLIERSRGHSQDTRKGLRNIDS